MDLNLEKFLKFINLPEIYYANFENCSLANVVYSKNSKMFKVHILLDKAFDPKIINAVLELVKEIKNYDVNFLIKDTNSINEEIINGYYALFVDNNLINSYSYEAFKKFSFSLDNDEYVLKLNKSQKQIFDTLVNDLISFYNKIGISLKLRVDVSELDVQKELEKIEKAREMEREKALERSRQINNFKANEVSGEKNKVVKEFKRRDYVYDDIKIDELRDDDQNVSISGKIFHLEITPIRNEKNIYLYYITDDTNSIGVKVFEGARFKREDLSQIKVGTYVNFKGSMTFDQYTNSYIFSPTSFKIIEPPQDKIRTDNEVNKRVELHTHTIMSMMDATATITDYCQTLKNWGHKAVGLTDHGCIQSFPEAQAAEKKTGIKIIYGTEAYMVEDKYTIVYNEKSQNLENANFVVLDFETTGLSNKYDTIIEFGGVKVVNGEIVKTYQTFINPLKKLSAFTTNLTGISEKDVCNAPSLKQALHSILEFIGDSIIVAHNAEFDFGMLNASLVKIGLKPLTNTVIDTLALSRVIFPSLRRYTLGSLCHQVNVEYNGEEAHRADYDAKVTAEAFLRVVNILNEKFNVTDVLELNKIEQVDVFKKMRPTHVTIYAKDEVGFKNLFKLISFSNVDYIADVPKLPRSVIEKHREGLIIGSACLNGEIFDLARRESDDRVQEAMKFYDFIEVQPLPNYKWLVDTERAESIESIKQTVIDIIDNAKKVGKLVVATGDCHYVNPEDKIYRDVYICAEAVGQRRHPLFDYSRRVKENPDQHLRTTSEMLDEFAFLGEELAYEIVVTNSNIIADMTQNLKPIKDNLNTPKIEGVEDKLSTIVYENAHRIYGETLPEIVEKRIEKELKSINGNGYAVIYYISEQLVKKSNSDGFLVGSRGSVGSSFVATMAGITEVNALKPHYVCSNPDCKYTDFSLGKEISSGFDLPDKKCPKCSQMMKGDGHDIPFETFLGFYGDKVPDIDLNFSGEYQPRAHEFTRTLLGEKNVYRAGTILTVAEKTAKGYVRKYFEEKGIDNPRYSEVLRIAKGCEGVKRTTGQHAGGIIVIPSYMDVYDVTPLQYPADDPEKSWMTSHFDFHAIHDEILKLDILGHDDPTAIRMLQDITGVDPKSIPMNDPKVLSLFSSLDALGVTSEQVLNHTGTAGLPEFGTDFVKRLIDDTHPTKFSELVQISGLSHGTGVWAGNAQDLIKENICTLDSVIGCRDDIMAYLLKMELEPADAFKIMESVRKGKGLSDDFKAKMRAKNVPEWYIDSCLKIQYMFPKAHAVAYVMMALRIAWFKVYYPLEYYATYFTTRCDTFDIVTLVGNYNAIKEKIQKIRTMKTTRDPNLKKKDEDLIDLFDVALEMCARGFTFSNIDMERSDSKKFIIDHERKCLIPPFICVDGLGMSVAESIVNARKDGPFLSKEDIMSRTQISNTVFKFLDNLGCFKDLNDENQLQFNLF